MTADEARQTAIDYSIEKSSEALESAQAELAAGRCTFAVNRVYYACFYAAVRRASRGEREIRQALGRARGVAPGFGENRAAVVELAPMPRGDSTVRRCGGLLREGDNPWRDAGGTTPSAEAKLGGDSEKVADRTGLEPSRIVGGSREGRQRLLRSLEEAGMSMTERVESAEEEPSMDEPSDRVDSCGGRGRRKECGKE